MTRLIATFALLLAVLGGDWNGPRLPAGPAPAGYGAAAFAAAAARPAERATVISDGDVAAARTSGFASGACDALLLALAALQLFALVTLRHRAAARYLAVTWSLLGVEIARQAFFPSARSVAPEAAMAAVASLAAFAFARVTAFRFRSLRRERGRIERDLQAATFAAGHDDLTGLSNRRGLEARFAQAGSPASTVLFVDLDGFKRVNDVGGHAAGDQTLNVVARILRHAVRSEDIVARIGGDEFVVVLVGCAGRERAADVTARISSAVSFVRPLGAEESTRIDVSIGCSSTADGASLAAAIAAADADAYRVKAEHRAAARPVKRRHTGGMQA